MKIDEEVINKFVYGYEPLKLTVNTCKLKDLLVHKDLTGVELYHPPQDESIASAMLSTYVTQASTYQYNGNGEGVGVYMTETGCPPSGYLNNYTRLSGNDSNHSRLVSSTIRNVSPNAHIYCRGGYVLPSSADIGMNANTPPIFVVNLSYGYVSSDNSYTSMDKAVDDLAYNMGVTVVKSAGNNGSLDGLVSSPGRGLNVITVGNYNDYTYTPSLFSIASSSSYKGPNTKNMKPEVSAPGMNIDGATAANGSPIVMSGTSFAAPHVAGMLANLGSMWSSPNYNSFTPALSKNRLLSAATDYVQGGKDKVGVGGVDFYGIYNINVHTWFKGNFDTIDANDSYPNNGAIDRLITVSASSTKARVSITWLNRGDWTYAHRNDSFPMGEEYGLLVYDPEGNLLESEWNPHNGFAMVDFEREISGQYRFSIRRLARRDTNATLNMHFAIKY